MPRNAATTRLASLLLIAASALATRAQTSPLLPSGVAYDATGNLYFADTNRHQVFESTLAGQLIVVAGTGTQGFSGDGGPAIAATLDSPQGVAIGLDGTLYIADTGNQRIRAVRSGAITTFAGTGAAGFDGDNGPATAALFDRPNALAIDTTGALLLCDSGNHRVRRIASGIVASIAGSGVQGFSGDNGPAIAAQLDTPSGIAVAADGRVFLADTHNHRIRVIATNGNISTYAGTGAAGYAGDGALATAAQLASPRGLFATASGALLIADSNNQRIRQIDPSGLIFTLAGNGQQGSTTDGAPASTSLDTPRSVAISAFAAPVFADAGNRLVRELIANGNLYAPAGLVPARTSAISLTVAGQTTATAAVTGSAGTPQGIVELFDGTVIVAQATLAAGAATIAIPALSAGQHALTAAYLGDGVNPAATSAAVTVGTPLAASVTTEQPAPSDYAGLPLALTANVASATTGTPSGTIAFLEGPTTVATAAVAAGTATGYYLAPTAGTHQIVASYSGDTTFAPSSSAPIAAIVKPLPDFTLTASGSTTQTVQAGAIAVYLLTIASQPAPFTGAVSMGISSLPTGVTAAFSPTQVVPGTSSAQVTLSLATSASLVRLEQRQPRAVILWALLVLPMAFVLRHRRLQAWSICLMTILLATATGCGDRVLPASSQPNLTFSFTVAGTGTNLAGNVVMHSLPITLIVQ